ncbi:ABC-three component system middle component 1 [Brevibacillus marinus]|uniref:ABC-three component system middle component 1 n=1 Tax=Brevibacillus marinus TaxID=2496837 RepID=UPI000F82AC92|nr:ABC-three component system middle component 1 [Brevibacillus marinus]
MKELLETIFAENRFHINYPPFLGDIHGFLASSADDTRMGFFLVLFEDETVNFDELDKRLHTYFVEIKRMEEGYDRRMDKNITLIISLKRRELSPNEVLNRKIFELEEDPYFFRKLVLPYTDAQVEVLKSHRNGRSITETLYSILNDKEQFLAFKKSPYEETAYHLTTLLFIKLPFLNFRSIGGKLEVLSDIITRRLSELGLESLRQSSLQLMQRLRELPGDSLVEKDKILNEWLEGKYHD